MNNSRKITCRWVSTKAHLVLVLAVALVGCSSLRQTGSPDKSVQTPEAKRLTEELASLTSNLLLMPYTRRSTLLALYGKPLATSTNDARLLVDRHEPGEGLVLLTYWTASNPDEFDSLQWADFNLGNEPSSQDRAWRFDKWPEPVPDLRVLRRKVVLLRRLKEKLIRESNPIPHTENFMDGKLIRAFVVKEHFDLPVGDETWTYQGDIVAEGTYRDYHRWSGTFLRKINDTETFRQITYEDGVLLHSIIPHWERVDEPGRFIDPFVQGPASDFSLDDRAFVTNSNILALAHEDGFLEWAAKQGVTEGYRVVVKPSFSPAIIFNVMLRSTTLRPLVEWIMMDGQAGYPNTITKVARQSERRLSSAEIRDIRHIVSRSVFWTNQKEHSVGGCDGWFLEYEGILDKQYTYRHYFNTDAVASEKLAFKLLSMVPREQTFPGQGQPIDPYMWNLRNCAEDAIRLLEYSGHPEIVDEVLFNGSAGTLAHCIRKALELARDENMKSIITGDFESLVWDVKGGLLVYPGGNPISVVTRKEVAVWDSSWMYVITLGNGTATNDTEELTVKFTPSATMAQFRKTVKSPPLSLTAIKILRFLDLNPEFATVIDRSERWTKTDGDKVEEVLVVPPVSLAGAHSYTLTINHTKRSYRVSRSGGVDGGGSLYSREFMEDW